jgi:hypothetical protein
MVSVLCVEALMRVVLMIVGVLIEVGVMLNLNIVVEDFVYLGMIFDNKNESIH